MNKDEKSLVLLGASYMASIFLDKARNMGYKTFCFAWEKGAVAKNHADYFFPISVMEKEIIEKKCLELGVNGIISTTEAPIATCGYLTNQLHLFGNSLDTAINITNKGWVRDKTKACYKIRQPKYKVINDLNEAINWSEFCFPLVIKPVSGGGKRGVVVCDEYNEMAKALEYAFKYNTRKTGVLIEEYISGGKEYSVESLSYNGSHQIIQITEKISSGPPHCVELGHHQPGIMSGLKCKKVIEAVSELLDAVSFKNGPTHTEIKIVNDEVFLIELNARPGGDHIATKLIQLSTGYDYVANCIRVALGIQPERIDKFREQRYAGVYFVTKQTAFLKPIFDRCDNEDWLYEKHIESNDLGELTQNDCMHINYMIYCSDHKIDIHS